MIVLHQEMLNVYITPATLSNKGSNQFSLHSQWLSKKVKTGAKAASAPLTLDLIKPCLFTFLIILTFFIIASSSPSVAEIENKILLK